MRLVAALFMSVLISSVSDSWAQDQKAGKLTCPQCQRQGQQDWKYCPFDGAQLSDGSSPITTIEAAEAFAQSKGLALTDKKEAAKVLVANRTFDYKTLNGRVGMSIMQFRSTEAAKAWKDMVDKMPLGATMSVVRESVAFVIKDGTDQDRQDVYQKLGGVGQLVGKGGLPITGESKDGTPTPVESVDYQSKPSKDGMRVEILGFRVGKGQVRGSFDTKDRETKDEIGILRIKVTNITDTRKIDYRTPNELIFSATPELKDEFGNTYSFRALRNFDTAEGVELTRPTAINPEMSREDIYAFEVPVKKATHFIVEIPTKIWGGKDKLNISFPKELR